ncbi:MAG: radical SAM family heme chaperone HemW [Rhodanobacteraceae bacterium]|nr:radical SAM family heme chaperone HemW [Rhodanobacteraceae bacterium]
MQTGATLLTPGLSLYIHIPWCVRKCPYCDFNSHARGAELPETDYVAALMADLEQDLPLVWGRPVHSIFFGGGTPSLFSARAIGDILDGVGARLNLAPGLEVTLECNPGTAEHDRFEGYRAAGVNRLSFGIQSFDDGCLERLGRIHNASEAEAAVRMAKAAGFDDFNLDLMFALPGQTLDMALRDIERALAQEPTHLSHYQLTLEPNTVFAAKPPAGIPDEDGAWDIQDACHQRLSDAGFASYEVSAWARPGHQCRHNLNYWRFGDYLGIGAGAHGKVTLPAEERILRRWKHKHPARYLETAATSERIGGDEDISPAQRPFEYMLNVLRLVDGVPASDFEARTGLPLDQLQGPLEEARNRGWLVADSRRIQPTELGRRFTNDVISLFLAAD